MRLVASNTEIDPDIARSRGDEGVDRAQLVFGGFCVLGDFGGASPQDIIRLCAKGRRWPRQSSEMDLVSPVIACLVEV
jgi:hypothetical protein